MAQFTTLNLTNERVLVKGADQFGTNGEVVLDASEWNDVKRRLAHGEAHEDFEAAVEEFFAPLMEAVDKLTASDAQPKADPMSYVTLHEGTEARQGRDEVTIKLGTDSIVLRIIERGDFDRLVWVNDRLEVLEVIEGTDVPTTTEVINDAFGETEQVESYSPEG